MWVIEVQHFDTMHHKDFMAMYQVSLGSLGTFHQYIPQYFSLFYDCSLVELRFFS